MTAHQASGLTSQDASVDPILLSVYWNSLLAIVEEMGSSMRRMAFSDLVREGADYATALVDAESRLVAQGNYAPGHLGSVPFAVRNVIDTLGAENFRPGDTLLVNDAQVVSGHFPDIFLVSPVFFDGSIVAYAVNTVHHVDVGGYAPGSIVIDGVTEAYQEGLRVPPVWIAREGRVEENVLSIIMANSRTPREVRGDIMAQINTNTVGARALTKLLDAYGINVFRWVVDTIIDRTEARIRDRIREIPDGVYVFEDSLDDFGVGTDPIRIHVKVTVQGDDIEFDFSESSDQVAAGCNCYLNYTRAYTIFALRVFTDPFLPQNHGVFRSFKLTARPGCFFNPIFPAPSGGRGITQIRLFEAINGALAKAMPERGVAAFSHSSLPAISGYSEDGERFVMVDLLAAGYGGQYNKDGTESLSPIINTTNIPVEVTEMLYPVRVERFEFITDSAGPGKYRGGLGIRKDYELLCSSATVGLAGDRHVTPPYGLFGGGTGKVASSMRKLGGEWIALGSKENLTLSRGDVLSISMAGAGGYGDPADRDPLAIERDLLDGYITVGHARAAYGYEGVIAE